MIEIIILGTIIGGLIFYILYDCNQRQNIVMNLFGKKIKKRININTDYENQQNRITRASV